MRTANELLSMIIDNLDCSSNSCLFAKKNGMRTNGNCNCLEHLSTKQRMEIIRWKNNRLRK